MGYDYDLIVIGGGAAGLVAATAAASVGAKTCLIEKNKLGGDCTWYGCIPSKALLKSAQVFSLVKRLREFGIAASSGIDFDVSRVMPHVRDIVRKVSQNHPPELFEERGIKVFFGAPNFLDNRTIRLDGRKITSKRFIICTGSHPLVPPIDGLKAVGYLTNEDVFDLEVLPKSLAVLGAGPIGVEISQAFARLGVEVFLVEALERILIREDEEAVNILFQMLKKDGIKIYTGKKAVNFSQQGGLIAVTIEDNNKNQEIIKAEKVLVAIGRAPNVEGLELENAGVKYSKKGIEVNRFLSTTVKNIYAAGDVAGPYQFSHTAEYQAIIAVGNALFPFKRKVNYSVIPWCIFTEPELAHLGLSEEEARLKYKSIKVYRSDYKNNDRAVTDLEETGLSKVITDKKGYILGAHIVGANAGEIMHDYVLAKSAKMKIVSLSKAVHIYPTLAQVVKRSADRYYIDILNAPIIKKFFKIMLKFLR